MKHATVSSAADMLELRRQLQAAMGNELTNHEVVMQRHTGRICDQP